MGCGKSLGLGPDEGSWGKSLPDAPFCLSPTLALSLRHPKSHTGFKERAPVGPHGAVPGQRCLLAKPLPGLLWARLGLSGAGGVGEGDPSTHRSRWSTSAASCRPPCAPSRTACRSWTLRGDTSCGHGGQLSGDTPREPRELCQGDRGGTQSQHPLPTRDRERGDPAEALGRSSRVAAGRGVPQPSVPAPNPGLPLGDVPSLPEGTATSNLHVRGGSTGAALGAGCFVLLPWDVVRREGHSSRGHRQHRSPLPWGSSVQAVRGAQPGLLPPWGLCS